MDLDRDDKTPLYVQLADAMREQIRSGQIPPRHALPSGKWLTQELGISLRTVNDAMNILKQEQLIEWIPGKGLYVREPG